MVTFEDGTNNISPEDIQIEYIGTLFGCDESVEEIAKSKTIAASEEKWICTKID